MLFAHRQTLPAFLKRCRFCVDFVQLALFRVFHRSSTVHEEIQDEGGGSSFAGIYTTLNNSRKCTDWIFVGSFVTFLKDKMHRKIFASEQFKSSQM